MLFQGINGSLHILNFRSLTFSVLNQRPNLSGLISCSEQCSSVHKVCNRLFISYALFSQDKWHYILKRMFLLSFCNLCMHRHMLKEVCPMESSRGLYWESKMYKLKRFIVVSVLIASWLIRISFVLVPFSLWSTCCDHWQKFIMWNGGVSLWTLEHHQQNTCLLGYGTSHSIPCFWGGGCCNDCRGSLAAQYFALLSPVILYR